MGAIDLQDVSGQMVVWIGAVNGKFFLDHRFVPILFWFCTAGPQRVTQEEVYREFQPSYDIVCRSGRKGCSDHRFFVTLAYTTLTQSQQPVQDSLSNLANFKGQQQHSELNNLPSKYDLGSISLDFSDCTSCLLYTSPSPRDRQKSRMPSSA